MRSGDGGGKALRDLPGLADAAQKVGGYGTGLFGFENQAETMRHTFETLKKESGTLANLFAGSPLAGRLGMEDDSKKFKEWIDFSLLPSWRGAAPVQHAVMAGDEVTGATTFRLEAGLDTGPVYGLLTETVRPTDTSGELLTRLADAGAGLLVATLDAIADGSITPRPQSAEGVSLAPKVDVADARIDWHAAAQRVDRLVRGCTPAPGAWTTWRGERLKLGPVLPAFATHPLPPGHLRAGRREVEVGTATVPVVLTTVQPQGKRAMPAADWARGSRLLPGERLGDDPASDGGGVTS